MKRSNVQQLNCAPGAPDAANSDPGLASVQKGTKKNPTTNGLTDVQGGQKTTGSSRQRGVRHGDRSCLAPPGRSSLSTPEKTYGISGAEKGLVGEQQLKRWCKLLAEHGLQVEWSPGEAGIRKRYRRHDEANRSCGRASRVSRMQLFTVVEQDVPPLLPVGIMRTLQASLDLDDSGDKVIFRQVEGESVAAAYTEKWTHGHPRRPR